MANQYMSLAIEEARTGIHAGHGGPFGCVIVKDGAVVIDSTDLTIEEVLAAILENLPAEYAGRS